MEYDGITELLKAAPKRMDDARELLEQPSREQNRSDSAYRHNCGAQYLAGYAVECVLKAYIIDRTDAERRVRTRTWSEVLEFRRKNRKLPDLSGAKSHDLGKLLQASNLSAIMDTDRDLKTNWGICCKWKPSLRYLPVPLTDRAATEEMVDACHRVYRWLHGQVQA